MCARMQSPRQLNGRYTKLTKYVVAVDVRCCLSAQEEDYCTSSAAFEKEWLITRNTGINLIRI